MNLSLLLFLVPFSGVGMAGGGVRGGGGRCLSLFGGEGGGGGRRVIGVRSDVF